MIAQGFIRKVLIATRVAAMLPAFLLGLPAQWLALHLAPPLARWMPVYFHRYLLFVLGVRVKKNGDFSRERPLLLAANHLSWLDILVISSLMPVSFIAKSEVGEWPIFGMLARLQRSVFVERERRAKTGEAKQIIARRLASGDVLVLFAEGTTSDGKRILPFRSALLGAAQALAGVEGAPSTVQGLNIAYPRLGGLPIPRNAHAFIAWHGDMDLVPHLMDFFALLPVDCEVTLLDAHSVDAATNRKRLTRDLEEGVRRSHAMALRGAI